MKFDAFTTEPFGKGYTKSRNFSIRTLLHIEVLLPSILWTACSAECKMLPYLKNEIDTKSFKNYLFSMDEQDLIYCIYPLCILAIRSTSTFHFGIPYVFSCINYCCWPHSRCNGGKMYLCRSAVFTLVLLLLSLIMGKHKTHSWWLHYSMQCSTDFSKTFKVFRGQY